jgi:hypothetical protein
MAGGSTKQRAGAGRTRATAAAPTRSALTSLLDEVESDHLPRRVPGRRVAVVSLADLRRLRALEREDHADVAAIEAAMRDPRPSIRWETVKADLGL